MQPEKIENYCEHYVGRRYLIYKQAGIDLKKSGIERRSSNVKAFVKIEKFLTTYKKGDEEVMKTSKSPLIFSENETKRMTPRLVQPRKPIFNVAVGIYLHQLEFPIYALCARLLSDERIPCIIKGYNAFEVGSII